MTEYVILIGAFITATAVMLAIHALEAKFMGRRRSQVRPPEAGTEPRITEAQPRTQRARGGGT